MKKLLHIIATPRASESHTLQVSQSFLQAFTASHPNWVVEELNLFMEPLPDLTARRVDGKYILLSGKNIYGSARETWEEIINYIEQFISADGYLISTPMWNFSIPYKLKHYIDIIVQPKYMYRYTESGIEGLVKGKKIVIVISRGMDYSEDWAVYNHQESYLRTIFGFIGLSDITFIIAEPTDVGPSEVRSTRIEAAKKQAKDTAEKF